MIMLGTSSICCPGTPAAFNVQESLSLVCEDSFCRVIKIDASAVAIKRGRKRIGKEKSEGKVMEKIREVSR